MHLVRRQPEGAADTEIYFSVGHTVRADIPLPEAGGDESGMRCDWDAPVCLTHEPEACWNPVLLVYHEYVYLFYKTGNRIADWQTKVMVARTDTLFWGEARPLVPGDTGGGRGPVRTKPIILISGRICAGGASNGACGSPSATSATTTARPGRRAPCSASTC